MEFILVYCVHPVNILTAKQQWNEMRVWKTCYPTISMVKSAIMIVLDENDIIQS